MGLTKSLIFVLVSTILVGCLHIQSDVEDEIKSKRELKVGEEVEAQVSFQFIREKRATGEEEKNSDTVHLKLTVLDTDHHVKLRKTRDSIFSQNFKIDLASTDPVTKIRKVRDVTPSQSEINSIEATHFENGKENAVFSINNKTGEVTGYLKGMAVHSNTSEGGTSKVFVKQTPPHNFSGNDYMISPLRKSSQVKGRKIHPGHKMPIAYSTPELLVAHDIRFYEHFNKSIPKLLNYEALYFQMINGMYDTMPDPKVRFIISGVRVPTTIEEQDKIMGPKVNGSNCRNHRVNDALTYFNRYVANNKDVPANDLAILIADVNILAGSSGINDCYDALAGMAWLGEACNWGLKGAVAEGTPTFGGTVTAAHEMGHTLGCDDGGVGVMGAVSFPWAPYFTTDNMKAVKTTILNKKCLREIDSKIKPEVTFPKKIVHKGIHIDQLCQTYMPDRKYVKAADAWTNCNDLKCTYRDSSFILQTERYGPVPNDYLCDNKGGVCWHQKCISKLDRIFLKLDKEDLKWDIRDVK